MKSTEFRLGNTIGFGEREINISRHDIENMVKMEFTEGAISELYKPIPLTEEWLLKFGFTKSFAINNFAIQTEAGVLDLTPSENMGCHTYIEDNWIRTIESVHELQNLYFALTGQELTLKSE